MFGHFASSAGLQHLQGWYRAPLRFGLAYASALCVTKMPSSQEYVGTLIPHLAKCRHTPACSSVPQVPPGADPYLFAAAPLWLNFQGHPGTSAVAYSRWTLYLCHCYSRWHARVTHAIPQPFSLYFCHRSQSLRKKKRWIFVYMTKCLIFELTKWQYYERKTFDVGSGYLI